MRTFPSRRNYHLFRNRTNFKRIQLRKSKPRRTPYKGQLKPLSQYRRRTYIKPRFRYKVIYKYITRRPNRLTEYLNKRTDDYNAREAEIRSMFPTATSALTHVSETPDDDIREYKRPRLE